MNVEKKTSQMKSSAGEYLAPKVEVVEVKVRRVLCESDYQNTYGGFTNPEEEG